MSVAPIKLAVIVGSVRDGRFGPTVANWFVDRANEHGDFDVDVIDLSDTEIPEKERMAAADAFVIVTPEYNHSFPGPLKTAIDAFKVEWNAKPVGFVSYGGLSGGLRAVEALRPVLAELHAVTVRGTVSFHMAWEQFDDNGQPKGEAANVAAKSLTDQLAWWAHALRDAKVDRPYCS